MEKVVEVPESLNNQMNDNGANLDGTLIYPRRSTGKFFRLLLIVFVFLFTALLAEPLIWDPLMAAYYVRELTTANGEQARETLKKLHEMGPTGEKAVLRILNDPVPMRRHRAVQYLYRFQPEHTETLLLIALQDPHEDVWKAAEGALWGIWSKSPNETANSLFLQGIFYVQNHEWDFAITRFEAAFEEDPSFSECINQIANAHDNAGRIDEAIHYYLKTIELNPNHFGALKRLTFLYELKGDLEKAAYYSQLKWQVYPR